MIKRSHLIALLVLACSACSRSNLQVGSLDLRKPGSTELAHEFDAGSHILVGCRVSGLETDERGVYSMQADAAVLAQNKERPGEWVAIWSMTNFFQESKPAGPAEGTTRVEGDLLPAVQPGSYRLRVIVRDLEKMRSSAAESDIRIIATKALSAADRIAAGEMPSDPLALFSMGSDAYKAGDLEKAREYFEAAVALAPTHPELNFNLGMVYFGMGDRDSARKHFNAELGRDPAHVGSLSRLGDMSLEERDMPAATALFERLAEALPGNFYAHFKLGEIQLGEGKYDDAIKSFETVLSIDPTKEWASINLGAAYYRKGDNDAALRIYERLGQSPSAPAIVHLNYALALYKSGDIERARSEAIRARDMGARIDDEFLEAVGASSP